MQVKVKYQTLPGIIWTVIPRAWEKKRYCVTTFNELCWIQSIYKHIGEHSGFSWKDDWWDNILLVRKKICLKPLKLNVKFFLVAIWKKEKWLLYWPLDLKTLFNPTYSDTFTATSGLKTQGKIERGENGELYGDFQVKRGK